jgi:hypothetical protein
MARLTPGPFVAQPDQSPAEQLAAQAEYLNWLRDWIMREVQQREEAIEAEQAQARAELQMEANARRHSSRSASQSAGRACRTCMHQPTELWSGQSEGACQARGTSWPWSVLGPQPMGKRGTSAGRSVAERS